MKTNKRIFAVIIIFTLVIASLVGVVAYFSLRDKTNQTLLDKTNAAGATQYTLNEQGAQLSVTLTGDNTCRLDKVVSNNANIVIPASVSINYVNYYLTTMFDGGSNDGVFVPMANTLVSVTLPQGMTNVGSCAFIGCTKLTTINLPDTILIVGTNAFNGCTSVVDLYLPDSITTMKTGCCSSMSSLQTVHMPASLTTMGEQVFTYSTLTSIDIPAGVKILPSKTFQYCRYLVTCILHEGLLEISQSVFDCCNKLVNVTIPASVYRIANVSKGVVNDNNGSINRSTNEAHVLDLQVSPDNPYFMVDSKCLYSKDGKHLYSTFSSTRGELQSDGTYLLTVLDSVEVVEIAAICGNSNLQNISFGSNLRTIKATNFAACSNIRNIYVDATNQYFTSSSGALYSKNMSVLYRYPTNITGAILVDDLCTTLREYCFGYCKFSTISFGASVRDIDSLAFDNCTNFASYVVSTNNQNYSADQYGILYNKAQTTVIRCPKVNTGGTNNIVALPNTVTIIEDYAFNGCTKIKQVILNEGLISIGQEAFRDSRIEQVDLPHTLTTIGALAFRNTYLTSVFIPNSVTTIGDTAFGWNSRLLRAELEEGCTIVGWYMFHSNTYIKEIILPDSITTIGNMAFINCKALESIHIPKNVIQFYNSMLSGNTALTNVYLHNDMSKARYGSGTWYVPNTEVTYWFDSVKSLEGARAIAQKSGFFANTNFAMENPELTIRQSIANAGTISLNNQTLDSNTVNLINTTYLDTITLTAECYAELDYMFVGWRDEYNNAMLSTNATYTFEAKYDLRIVAVFEGKCYITLRSNNADLGTVIDNSGIYASNTDYVVSIALAQPMASFLYWLRESDGTKIYTNPLNVLVTQDEIYTAIFSYPLGMPDIIVVSVRLIDDDGEMLEDEALAVVGMVAMQYTDTDVLVSATASSGYQFAYFATIEAGNTTILSQSANATFKRNNFKNKTIYACFKKM